MSVTETNQEETTTTSQVLDMEMLCVLMAISDLDLLEHEHHQPRQWIISLVSHRIHQFAVNMKPTNLAALW